MKKRLLAWVLTVAMVMGMVNTSVFADSSLTDGVYFTKSIVNTSGQPDRLKLEAYTTGVVTSAAENIPTDIVLVLDQSGSMDYALGDSTVLEVMRDAVETFVDEIADMNGDSGNYRVAIVGFASQSDYNENTEILTISRRVEEEVESYVEVPAGEMDTAENYYVRRTYPGGSYYAEIEYREETNWREAGWYYENAWGSNQDAINLDEVTVYERVVTTETTEVYGISYDDLKADTSVDYASALVECDEDAISEDGVIYNAIEALEGEGATRTDLGLELAYDILSAAAQETGYDREQVVVLLTDGVPTTQSSFSSTVANNGVEYAKELKDEGAHIFSMYLGSPSTQAANFLQAVSSNYPDATSINNLGDQAANSYYSAHSESAAIKNVFSQIVSSILSDSQLNESSIVTDTISDHFRLPSIVDGEYDLEQIQVYTVDYLGGDDFEDPNNWATEEVPFDTASVELSSDGKTVEVTGFNFAYHCVTSEAKTTVTRALDYGRKLVIYIPIIADESSDNFGGYLPTNEDAEIIHNDVVVDDAQSCYADLTINYDLVAAERAYHVEGTQLSEPVEYVFSYEANMDSILNEMITGEADDLSDLRIPDGENNAGVSMVYRLYDIGTDDRETAGEGSTSDDKLVATLTVEPGDPQDVTNASKWTWYDESGNEIDLEDLKATITIPANEYYAEKVYVLVCILTNRNDSTDSLTVYDYLDVSVTRGDLAHIVYGTIDEGGTVGVSDRYPTDTNNDEGSGDIVGGTYTEAVIEGHSSDTMVFSVKPGYEIETILLVTSDEEPFDTRHYIYNVDDPTIESTEYPVNLTREGGWEVYVDNVTSGVAFEIEIRPLVFTLDTTADEGSTVTEDTTFTYSATETLDVYFAAKTGYYLTYVTVNGTVYTADAASDPELAEKYGLHITGTDTTWVWNATEGKWEEQTVITGGTIDLPRIKDYEVDVHSAKRVQKVTYNYYVEENTSTYTDWENAFNPTVAYVAYGDSLPLPNPTVGAETPINEDNYTLSDWYDTHDGLDFYGITDLTAVTMGAVDLDYHAYWAKNPSQRGVFTIQKLVTGAHTKAETFQFEAIFHEELVGTASITIPANSTAAATAEMVIELTDAEYDQFVAGNGAIYLYEVAGDATSYWEYDTNRYEIRWSKEAGEAIVWLNGEPMLDAEGGISKMATFTNKMIAESDLVVSEKKLVSDNTNVKVGDTLIWEITVTNNGYADGVLTADMIADEILYKDESGNAVSFVPAQRATIATTLPLTVAAQGSVKLTATWTVPYEAEGKTIVNNAKIGDDPGENSEETEIQEPDLKVEKRITKVGETVIEYDADGNRITAIPVVDPTQGKNVVIEWTITVTNEGAGPGKFTLTDVLTGSGVADAKATVAVNGTVETEEGYYIIPAKTGETVPAITFTAVYVVAEADASHTLINKVKITEHDDKPTDPEDPDKEDESDPVDVAPYTVTYMDGVDNEVVFEDQKTPDLKYGEETPKYQDLDSDPVKDNKPVREGYRFDGWQPEVAEKVTGNATYVAQWTKVDPDLSVTGKTLVRVRDADHNLKSKDAPIVVGDYLIWEVTVTNTGNGDGVVFAADFEDIVYYEDGGTWKAFDIRATMLPDKANTWPVGGVTVEAGESVVVLAVWQVPASAEGKTIKNAAKLNGPDDPKESEETKIAEPSLKVEKTVAEVGGVKIKSGDPIPVANIGDVIKWTITVTNEGDAAGKFKLVDQLNGISGKATISGSHRADADGYYIIPAKTEKGATVWEFTATYTVSEADKGDLLINKVTLDDGDPTKPDPTDETDEVPVEADLSVVKEVAKIAGKTYVDGMYAEVGDLIEWTITVTNNGETEGKFKLVDVLTGSGVADAEVTITSPHTADVDGYYTIPGKNGTDAVAMTFTASYQVVEEDKNATLKNAVSVDDGDNDPEDDPSDESDDIPVEPKLTVVKTVAKVGDTVITDQSSIPVAKAGEDIVWNIVITNVSDAAGRFKLLDVLTGSGATDGEVTVTGAYTADADGYYEIPAKTAEGPTVWTFTATYRVQNADKGAELINKVTLDDGDPMDDPDPSDEAEEVPVEDPDPANLETTKLIATIGGKAVEYNQDGSVKTKAKAGERIIWDILVKNTGEVATDVTVNDVLTVVNKTTGKREINTIIVDALHLKAGEEKTLKGAFHYDVQEGDITVQNVAIAATEEGKPSDPGETPEITVEDPALTVDKKVSSTEVNIGDTVTYTITVKNTGNLKLVDVVVDESAFGGDFSEIFNVTKTADDVALDKANNAFTIEDLDVDEEVTITFAYEVTEEEGLKNKVKVIGKPDGDDDGNPDPDPDDPTKPAPNAEDEDEAPDVEIEEEEDDPVTPVGPKPELDKGGDHLSYIIGYPDGNVRPLGTITRAEVATIFFRLLTDESRAFYWSQENSFSDVNTEDWFNNAVSTMAAAGIVNGYPDGTFRPQDPVSRAEFAAIATRFTEEGRDGVSQKYFKQYFKDVDQDDWYAAAVELAYELGWAQGYEGSYRPEDDMTRAEVMTMVNRIMEREVRVGDMLEDMIFWPDNDPFEWYYEAVQEATNSHTYDRTNDKVPNLNFYYEKWKKLLENPDWAALERAWSDANSQN